MSGTATDWYETVASTSDPPGVLLIHSAWGLTPCYRRMCDRLADAGFHVVAPDLYGGAAARTWEEAELLRARRHTGDRWTVISRATNHLRRHVGQKRPLGVVGLSMGGHWALFLAPRADIPIGATVVFCAVRGGDYSASRSAFQFHLAASDEFVARSSMRRLSDKLEVAGRPAEFYTYPGTHHWYCDQERDEAYDAAAAELAWQRTETFVQRHLFPDAATPAVG